MNMMFRNFTREERLEDAINISFCNGAYINCGIICFSEFYYSS